MTKIIRTSQRIESIESERIVSYTNKSKTEKHNQGSKSWVLCQSRILTVGLKKWAHRNYINCTEII